MVNLCHVDGGFFLLATSHNMIFPPPLAAGARIAIVAPASQVGRESIEKGIGILTRWGYEVRRGNYLYARHGQFAGNDDERLADLQQALDDPGIRAVIMARGGYGTTRIMDRLNFVAFSDLPKWIVGFSDITALHAQLLRQGVASIHGPMPGYYHRKGSELSAERLRRLLSGSADDFNVAHHSYNIPGSATGRLFGGNLAIVSHLAGTPSSIDTSGKILLLEDVGEYLYNIDRMMVQLKRSGALSDLAGLIVGQFNEMKDTKIPFGKNAYEIIADHVSGYGYPVAYSFPVGHVDENYPFVEGAMASLSVGAGGSSLKFPKGQIPPAIPPV